MSVTKSSIVMPQIRTAHFYFLSYFVFRDIISVDCFVCMRPRGQSRHCKNRTKDQRGSVELMGFALHVAVTVTLVQINGSGSSTI